MKVGGNCIPSKPDLKLSRSVACATAVLVGCPTKDFCEFALTE